jgi:deoxyribodipyrimidine photo-lyase
VLNQESKKMNWNNDAMIESITDETVLFWFRRDLRLEDNAGLYHALQKEKDVLPIFIFDSVILSKLEDPNDARVDFIYRSLLQLKAELEELNSTLIILQGDPIEIFKSVRAKAVYSNHDFEPYARQRDESVSKILKKNGSQLITFKDHVIFEKDEVMKDDGGPYTIFTPYSKKWKATLSKYYLKSYPVEKYCSRLRRILPVHVPTLEDISFRASTIQFPPRVIKTSIIQHYHETRDYPAIHGTTRLSVHLRFGTVSVRKLAQLAVRKNEIWLNELIWRDFYAMILWHFPHVTSQAFKPAYDKIPWRNDEQHFQAWCEGKTGYPIVDAGMRELNVTGFMHNRLRMITASFLVKHLLIDWRWGETYFAKKLLDFDLASNNGGWQWVAGSGCDAAPYFRVFSPTLQEQKFDPERKYIRKWVPEVENGDYVRPIVDHKVAREHAIRIYRKGLSQDP